MDEYLLDTKWACGLIIVKDGIVIDGATIFRKLFGQSLIKLQKIYKVTEIGGDTIGLKLREVSQDSNNYRSKRLH